jgi:hypothetical protein
MRIPMTSALILLLAAEAPAVAQLVTSVSFETNAPGEAVGTIDATCPGCDWGVPGREAVTLKLALDGAYSQHLVLTRPGKPAYRVMLGPVAPGEHRLTMELDPALSARHAGSFGVGTVDVRVLTADAPEYEKIAFAPFIYERPNAIGRFSDTPLLMWIENDTTPAGKRFRYSVIFSNEDGGTPADRLMATWGRTTDIELVYDVAMDATGRVLKEEIQAPKHEMLPFEGPKLGSHPLLWVVTDNNMVSGKGETTIRHGPAPLPLGLADRSREAVMDANPWTYRVMSEELARERKIDPRANAGSGIVPDPRRYVYIEACGELSEAAAIAFDVGLERSGRVEWFATDRGVPQFRIARSGCFRAAAPLPEGVALVDSSPPRLRARVYRKAAERDTPAPAGPVSATLRRVNLVFMLTDEYRPGPSAVKWIGMMNLTAGTPVEIPR